uniref:Long wavelength sensitive opsin 3 n=1 Tax=Eulasia bombylius TaxID=1661826 RepID=A0A8F2P735_9SCAR|nr:long wavelength sensitive opsin 3 [Eulasia bombylius]
MSVSGQLKFSPWVASARIAGGFRGNLTVVDLVPPDMLHMVDNHWYQYPPMDPMWYNILTVLITILSLFAIVGNGMVLYIFGSTKSLRTPSNLLVCNLALSDFGTMSTMGIPVIITSYHQKWILGPFMCELYGCLGGLFGGSAIWTMAIIALDRYNVIVKGLSGKPLTIKGALLKLLLVWLFIAGWTIAPLFGWGRYTPEGNMTACGTDYLSKSWVNKSYILAYSAFVYFLPLFTIIYSYWFIVQAVAAHEKAMREQAKKMNVASLRSSDTNETSAECKLAKVALVTISLWFMAWTPYLITNYIGVFETASITPLGSIWCSVFAKTGSVYNPIVYAISHPKYKQALHAKFPFLQCGGGASETTSAASGAAAEENKA